MDTTPDDPTTLGPYRVVSRLGVGEMGRVLLGVDDAGRRVALRVVHAELAAAPGFRERFRHEIEMAASAPQWFTALVFDADPEATRPWLATAYVEGPSLQAYVNEQGPFSGPGLAALAVRMADGLVALHGGGLVHRDLKPSNVLLADDGPRLIDFGISRAVNTSALRQDGQVFGTPAFMSPEQASGARDIGPAGDMFSFGSLLVFAATGRSPFAAESAAETLHRVRSTEPDLGPLAGRVREVVAGCLAKDPAARPTAAEVRGLLRDGEDPVPVAAAHAPTAAEPPDRPTIAIGSRRLLPAPAPPGPARRTWVVVAVIVAVALLGSAAAAVLLLRGRGGGATPVAAAPTSFSAPASPTGTPPTSVAVDPLAGSTVIDAPADPRFGTDQAAFATPSGNIACLMTADEVRCDVLERTWTLPPTPADCDLDFGRGVLLGGAGPAQLSCVGDTVAGPTLPKLAYGAAVRFAGVMCVSRETGMRCENPVTGHGFRVSRGSFEVF